MPVLYLAALLLALVAGLLATNRAGYLRRNFIYLVLPINAAADVLMEIVHLGALNSGQIRGVLMMLFVGAMLPRLRIARPTIPVFVWLLYLLPLIFLSSNLPGTLAVYSKMALAYMMLPIAYVMIRDEESFRKLLMSLAVAAYVFVAGIVVFQLFKLGVQVYKEGSLYTFGRGQAKFTKVLAYAVVLFPLLMHMARPLRYKALHVAGHVLAFLVVLVTFHRSSIIAVALGYAVLIVVGFERTRLVKSALVGLLIGFSLLVFVAPSYYDTLMAMYERRATFETELEAEAGRFTETEYVIDAMLEGSIVNVLFGRELFNGGEVMGWTKSDGRIRPLHVDYNIVLFGSGVVGLILYLLVYVQAARSLLQNRRYLPRGRTRMSLVASFFGLLVASLVASASNQMWAITSLSAVFLMLGGMLGLAAGARDRVLHAARLGAAAPRTGTAAPVPA